MAGLLNSTPAQAAPAAAPAPAPAAGQQPQQQGGAADQQLDDPLLIQTEKSIEQSVPPEHKQMFDSIVLAGMNVMFSKETASLMEQQLDEGGDIVSNVSDGVAKLIMIVFNESKQDVNAFMPASVLAAVVLMCQALDYAEQTRGAQVTPEIVAQCTKQTQLKVLKTFGVSEEQVNQVAASGMQQMQQGGAAPQAPQAGV
jgi:hypothetical protein